jgi:hypothetical protein
MTVIQFTPSTITTPPFQVNVTLDGTSYSLVTMWNFYRGDWYVSLTDQNGNIIINQPLIGSPPDSNIYLFPGLFTTSTVVYRVSTGQFEITP